MAVETTGAQLIRKIMNGAASRDGPFGDQFKAGDPMEEAIAAGLKLLDDIRDRISTVKAERESLKEYLETEDSLLTLRLEGIQKTCPHWETRYSRPTAECDPTTTCMTCGMDL